MPDTDAAKPQDRTESETGGTKNAPVNTADALENAAAGAGETETQGATGDEIEAEGFAANPENPAEAAADEPQSKSEDETIAEDAAEENPARELTDDEKQQLALCVEAAILTTDRAISPAKLNEAMDKLGTKAIKEAVESLNALYEETGRSFRIELVSNGYRFMTLPRFANVLAALKKTRSQTKLSPSALETLAVIAYKQPALRADVEAVRGVACGETIRALMERGLVKIVGRSEEIGRPMLYGTTPKFLEVFGLANLKDLPKAEDLQINA